MIVLPLPAFIISFLLLSGTAWLGATRFPKLRAQAAALRQEFGVIQAATLTLLGLIIGFTFSMALDRYDQRKAFESAEASAIETAYRRAELLPDADAARVRKLILVYLDQRLAFYAARSFGEIRHEEEVTAKTRDELWKAVKDSAKANPSPLTALAVAAMSDVFSAQGNTQASWANRIPATAWMLMLAIAACATLLVGIGLRQGSGFSHVLAVLPLVIAIAFFLIADIESPRLGLISVSPGNLMSLAQSLRGGP
ncbi:MAG: DUF4239 domain-containing protein [Gammaproteobacteria bacterium]|nr:DUF4239 domain-containing protein [Gammaproteobacteria bacterium]